MVVPTRLRTSSHATLYLCFIIGVSIASTPDYPTPLSCTGDGCDNITISIQDFSVIQHQNGTFFRISRGATVGMGLSLASAPAIDGPWKPRQRILGANVHLRCLKAGMDRANTHLWAPEIHYIGSTYYVYYSICNNDSNPAFDICVATSPNMDDNAWTDHGSVGISQPPGPHTWAKIDQSVLTDESVPYAEDPAHLIVWGSLNAALYGMPLVASNPLKANTSQTPRPFIQDQPVAVPDPGGIHGSDRTEGSYLWKAGTSAGQWRGWYYFFYSRGLCCTTVAKYAYVTEVCRAQSPQGPYRDRNGKDCAGKKDGETNGSGTVILASHSPDSAGRFEVLSPGSVGIVGTSSGLFMTYQYKNQMAPSEVDIRLYFGHHYLKFDGQGWPFLLATL